MSKFTFKCECGKIKQIVCSHHQKMIECECGKIMVRQLPISNSKSTVKETVDPYTNQQQIPDQKEHLKERHDKYFYEVEVPRLVASGVYCLETILRNGWGYLDDNDQLVLYNKPPSER